MMSRLERILLFGIVFLLLVKVLMTTVDPDATPYGGQPGSPSDPNIEAPDPVYGAPGAPGAGAYDWNPDTFSRKSIPPKVSIDRSGRLSDSHNLNDTQKAYVYATLVRVYNSMLDRAERDCDPKINSQILRWEQTNAATITNAEQVLARLKASQLPRTTQTFLALPASEFRRKVCPQIERSLASGTYTPHPEAVDRLAHAVGAP